MGSRGWPGPLVCLVLPSSWAGFSSFRSSDSLWSMLPLEKCPWLLAWVRPPGSALLLHPVLFLRRTVTVRSAHGNCMSRAGLSLLDWELLEDEEVVQFSSLLCLPICEMRRNVWNYDFCHRAVIKIESCDPCKWVSWYLTHSEHWMLIVVTNSHSRVSALILIEAVVVVGAVVATPALSS